ncbi:unnamed protein product [Albugo candida]|uniref:Uncharacterized protein n=1 Tax=Albugo candida TaxID=65357 RepID=A0A024GTR9_9STRA|nr:unnamed protein product [Albugo candida]|eukprot:CCI49759.1 unnamed protein product [Albugo candida]
MRWKQRCLVRMTVNIEKYRQAEDNKMEFDGEWTCGWNSTFADVIQYRVKRSSVSALLLMISCSTLDTISFGKLLFKRELERGIYFCRIRYRMSVIDCVREHDEVK